jgi:sugar/nucleoside kinase (ribokinase family)
MDSNSSPADAAVSVAVLGDAMIDYVVEIDSRTSLDEKHAVTTSSRRLGGSGANAAAAVTALCGAGTARLFATVSDDEWGHWISARVRDLGIDGTGIRSVAGPVPHAVIVDDGGTRHLLVDRGVADDVIVPTEGELSGHHVVYTSNPVACLERLRLSPNTCLVVGVEHQMLDALSDESLNRAAILITNAAGWSVLRQRSVTVPAVETRGELGVRLHRPGVPPVDVVALEVDAVDSTGAGDAFAGALCSYLAKDVKVVECIRRANAVAAVAVATQGSHLGPVDPALIERLSRQSVSAEEVSPPT